MEENDTMEGKKLELHMFEQKILEAIEIAEQQKNDKIAIQNGEMNFEIDIRNIDKKTIKIHAFGEEILTLEDGKNFTYNMEGLKNIREKLNKTDGFDFEQFGMPDIEYLEELKKQRQEQKDEKQRDEKDLSEDIEEKKEDSPEEKEEKSEDEEKEKIARRHNVNSDKVIHVSMNKRITDHDQFQGLAKWAKDYKDIYILSGKDEYSWETIGINKDGEEEKINSKQQEGKNPNVIIKKLDGKEITEVRPIAMYEIDKKQSYAVIRDEVGKPQMLYCRQEAGDGRAFLGITVPEADTKNVYPRSAESREIIDPRNNSAQDLSKKSDEIEKGADLEKRGIPSKEGKGVQVKEIEGTTKQNSQLRKEDIIDDLLKRDDVKDKSKVMPGFYEHKAGDILRLMERNDKITYEEAIEQVERRNGNRNDEDQKMPGENPRRREY